MAPFTMSSLPLALPVRPATTCPPPMPAGRPMRADTSGIAAYMASALCPSPLALSRQRGEGISAPSSRIVIA